MFSNDKLKYLFPKLCDWVTLRNELLNIYISNDKMLLHVKLLECIVEDQINSVYAVSYTHLDVYKRQV